MRAELAQHARGARRRRPRTPRAHWPMDYGTDFDGVDDLHPSLREVSGPLAVVQAIARRFMTPRGALFYDREYGFDLRAYVNTSDPRVGAIVSGAQAEAEKDERVARAQVKVQWANESMTVFVTLELVLFGTFRATLSVDEVSVSILNVEAA